MSLPRSYLVCATERSGSTLLCELLAATGVAGRPEEYFEFLSATGRPRQPREYFEGVDDPAMLELLRRRSSRRCPPCRGSERLADARERGTTPNGVFAAKMMWAYLDDFLGRTASRERAARAAALGPRRAPRQARAGDLAVARGADRAVARRGPRRRRRARLPRRRDRAPQATGSSGTPPPGALVRRARHRAAGVVYEELAERPARRPSAGCSTTSACRARRRRPRAADAPPGRRPLAGVGRPLPARQVPA